MKTLDILGEVFAGLAIAFALVVIFAPQLLWWLL